MATSWVEEQNGVYAEYHMQDGVVHRRKFDPLHNQRLSHNAEVRKNGTRMMSWGKQVADIPEVDLPALRSFFGQALFNPKYDKFDRRIAREKFLKSPASDPYRVEERRRRIK